MLLNKQIQGTMSAYYANGEELILSLTWKVFLSENIAHKALEIPWKIVIKAESEKLLKYESMSGINNVNFLSAWAARLVNSPTHQLVPQG